MVFSKTLSHRRHAGSHGAAVPLRDATLAIRVSDAGMLQVFDVFPPHGTAQIVWAQHLLKFVDSKLQVIRATLYVRVIIDGCLARDNKS
jgi:hypothetical protein